MVKYQGIVLAGSGFLLGGVKIHKSSLFEKKEDAQNWLVTAVETNLQANRSLKDYYVAELDTKEWTLKRLKD